MKKIILLLSISILLVGITSCKTSSNEKKESQKKEVDSNSYNFKTSFTKILENAKSYTLEVAETMAAEDYSFRTTDSVRTFGEQMAHIGMSNQFILVKLIMGEKLPDTDITEQEIGASKEMTIALLNKSFDDIITALKAMDNKTLNEKFTILFLPEKPEYLKHEGFVFLRDHITHHRGQAIVYLRAKGYKAPQYRAF